MPPIRLVARLAWRGKRATHLRPLSHLDRPPSLRGASATQQALRPPTPGEWFATKAVVTAHRGGRSRSPNLRRPVGVDRTIASALPPAGGARLLRRQGAPESWASGACSPRTKHKRRRVDRAKHDPPVVACQEGTFSPFVAGIIGAGRSWTAWTISVLSVLRRYTEVIVRSA